MKEVVSSAIKPVERLIEIVANAIGKAYEPRHIKKMADAKAYEIKTISEEIRNNTDLPIVYDSNGGYSIDITDYESLVNRTGKRIAYQEIKKQENIEAIIDAAYDSLESFTECEEGEISREWMCRFIDSASDISSKELQVLWSKILAGKVLSPKTFSLRTLECLRNMDSTDAHLFEKICKVIVINSNCIVNDSELLRKYKITYADILALDDCGLINSSGTIALDQTMDSEPRIVLDFGSFVFIGKDSNGKKLTVMEYPLTVSGRELYKIAGGKLSDNVIKDICSTIIRKNKGIELTLHRVKNRIGDSVSYEMTPISIE